MLHGRKDYQERIQDAANLIPENEPVLLFRAQDKHCSAVAEFYADLIRQDRIAAEEEVGYAMQEGLEEEAASQLEIADELMEFEKVIVHHARRIRLWPKKKKPDLPKKQNQ